MAEERPNENWAQAQRTEFSIDVVASAKQLWSLLAAVDRHPCLYVPHSPAVSAAIRRPVKRERLTKLNFLTNITTVKRKRFILVCFQASPHLPSYGLGSKRRRRRRRRRRRMKKILPSWLHEKED
jgi:hypothetical protein